MTTRTEIYDTVIQMIEEESGRSTTEDSLIMDHLDSLDLIELTMDIEDKYDIVIKDLSKTDIKTVGQFVDYLQTVIDARA
jgi:acyl carrier protein